MLLDDWGNSFDAVVLRPTIVYGLSSSLYGSLFDLAADSNAFRPPIVISNRPSF